MIHGGFRHLPVVDGGKPVGIVSIRDLMRVIVDDETPAWRLLEMFVDGAWTVAALGRDVHRGLARDGRERSARSRRATATTRGARSRRRTAPPAAGRALSRVRPRRGARARRRRRSRSGATTLARTLTLDQGKPLAEARDEVEELVQYWRNAAEDGKRLEGRLANSMSPGKRVLLVRRPRGVIGVITPWNWPYTMPAELIAPALAARQHRRLDARVDDGGRRHRARRVRRRGRSAARRLQPRHRPGLDRRRRDRAQSRHARRRLHRLDRDRPPGRRGRGGQGGGARARRQRAGRRARRRRPRRSPPRRPRPRASSAPARAAPPASGCSCTATCARSSSRSSRRSSPSASCSATRSPTARRWARSTTRASRRRWTSTSPTR